MEFFEQQWRSYQAIVEHNLMEHGPLAEATAAVLDGWLEARAGGDTAGTGAPRMVDLGCGDLARLAPLLRRLPLGAYTGLDRAGVVLPLAKQALGTVPYPTGWQEGDLLTWATQPERHPGGGADGRATSPAVEILHSAFAIHHLSDAQKVTFLQAARRRISPGGIFLWADVFRESGEDLAAYLERYVDRIRRGWHPLSPEQQDQAIAHVRSCDIPADRAAIEAAASAAGWRWRWAWQGQHRAEALAVLTPAEESSLI